MPKSIEIPFSEAYGADALKNLTATLERIAASQAKPNKTIGELRYENAILAVLTRIADALDAIHGTLAEATRPDIEIEEVHDDPE